MKSHSRNNFSRLNKTIIWAKQHLITVCSILLLCSINSILSSCGIGSSALSNVNNNNTGSVGFTLTSPSAYPAQNHEVTAYVTVTNTSNYNAQGLSFLIPEASNHTGTAITVVNGATNPCYNIAANTSCSFPITLAAGGHPGSFRVLVVTPASGNTSLFSKIKHFIGLGTDNFTLKAAIGTTNLPSSNASGANGITILYPTSIIANSNGSTLVTVVAVVNSPNAGNFNTINLTTANGTLLTFTPLSGNSGNGLTNLSESAIVTLNLTIPAGVSSYTFHVQTAENGNVVNQGDRGYALSVTPSSTPIGILNVEPSYFTLESGYAAQTLTYTNSGNAAVKDLNIIPGSPLTTEANTCTDKLESGDSCTYRVAFDTTQAVSGSTSVVSHYHNGEISTAIAAAVNYIGVNPESGLTITGNLTFTTTTASPTESSQITITNTGNSHESNISFTVPTHFSLNSGNNNSCSLSGNTVTNSLAKDESCTLTLAYSNSTATATTTADLTANYTYGSNQDGSTTVTLTYATIQSSAALSISPAIHNFGAIANESAESSSHAFNVTNTSSDTTATDVTTNISGNYASSFTITGGTCSNSIAAQESCSIAVRFGPVSSSTHLGIESAILQVAYTPYVEGSSATTTSTLVGRVRSPTSADMTSTWSADGFAGGNGLSTQTALQIESANSATLNVIYTNSGHGNAANFTTTAVVSSPWSLSTHGCNNVTVESNNGTCTDIYTINSPTAGENDFSYENISASWNDESGNVESQVIIPDTGPTTYVNVYAAPYVIASLNPSINLAHINTLFSIVYNLYGGYQVANSSYSATFSGGNSMQFESASSCSASSSTPTCSLVINSGESYGIYTITPTTQGSIPIVSSPNPITMRVWAESVQISLAAIALTPIESAGSGSESTPFYVESQTANQRMTLTYVNNTSTAAQNFTVALGSAFPSSLYSVNTNNCNNTTLESNGDTCTLILNVATAESGSQNLSLESNSLSASWSDQIGSHESQAISWNNNGTLQDSVYLSIFNAPVVYAYLSSSPTQLVPITYITPNTEFYIYYQVVGGYPGESFTYTPTYDGSPQSSCTLTVGTTMICSVPVNSGDNPGGNSINFGNNSGGVTPTPPSGGNSIMVLSNVVAGLANGMVYLNNTLLSGSGAVPVNSFEPISAMAIGNSGNIYVATDDGINPSYVYIASGGIWTIVGESNLPNDISQIRALALNHNNNNLYAAGNSSNIYVSESATGIWQLVGGGAVPGASSIYALALDSQGTVYAATYNSSGNGSVYYINNNNPTWTQLGQSVPNSDGGISAMTIDGNDNVIVGTNDTSGSGYVYQFNTNNWLQLGESMPDSNVVAALGVNGSTIYAGTNSADRSGPPHNPGNVYQLVGNNWQLVGLGSLPDGGNAYELAFLNNNVYVSTIPDIYSYYELTTVVGGGNVYVSESATGAWSLVGSESLPNNRWTDHSRYNPISIYNNTLYAGSNGNKDTNNGGTVYQSLNINSIPQGTTWSGFITGAVDGTIIYSIAVNPTNGTIYASTASNNIFSYESSTESWTLIGGGEFATTNTGVPTFVTLDNSYNVYAATSAVGESYVARSANGSSPWQNSSNIISATNIGDILANTSLYASTIQSNGDPYVVIESNNTWITVGGGNVPTYLNVHVVPLLTQYNGTIYATQDCKVFSSTANGGGGSWWQQFGTQLNDNENVCIWGITASSTGNIYTAIESVNGANYVYYLPYTDISSNWNSVAGGLALPESIYAKKSISVDNSQNVYLGTGTTSTSGGNIYVSVGNNEPWGLVYSYSSPVFSTSIYP